MRNNLTYDKAYKFAIRVVKAYKYLAEEKREFVLSKQLLKSGTSIGANVAEARKAKLSQSSKTTICAYALRSNF